MKIEGAGSVKGSKVGATPSQKPFELEAAAKEPEKTIKGVSKEKVELSKLTELANKLVEAAKAAPDVRKEKVAQLKAEIDSGTYTRPPRAIAEKIIQEAVEFLKPSK